MKRIDEAAGTYSYTIHRPKPLQKIADQKKEAGDSVDEIAGQNVNRDRLHLRQKASGLVIGTNPILVDMTCSITICFPRISQGG